MCQPSRQPTSSSDIYINRLSPIMEEMDNTSKVSTDARGACTRVSRASSSSNASLAVAMARAKAEGAQARAAHSKREIELKVEHARIRATLDALKEEKKRMQP